MNKDKVETLEDFDQEVYARTSDNNMPISPKVEPLTEDEKRQLESAISF